MILKHIFNSSLTNKTTLEASDNKLNIKRIKYPELSTDKRFSQKRLVWYLILNRTILTPILWGFICLFASSHFLNSLKVQYKTYNHGDAISQIIWDGLDFNCSVPYFGEQVIKF